MRVALELALTFGPLCLMLVLLLVRCYPGEGRILARRVRSALRLERIRSRWARKRRMAPRATALARSSVSRRGPPVPA